MKHIIFYFSGTGNCLRTAKKIAEELNDAEIVAMTKPEKYIVTKQYETIGFVYPTYFQGLPNMVCRFAAALDFNGYTGAYIYAITTCGAFAGNAVSQLNDLLRDTHGIELNYGQKLRMFSNYIIMYNASVHVKKIQTGCLRR